jgi:hypothetical protein
LTRRIRRYGRQADLRPDFVHLDRTRRSARPAPSGDIRLCRNEGVAGPDTYALACMSRAVAAVVNSTLSFVSMVRQLCAGRRWLTLVVGNAQNIPF